MTVISAETLWLTALPLAAAGIPRLFGRCDCSRKRGTDCTGGQSRSNVVAQCEACVRILLTKHNQHRASRKAIPVFLGLDVQKEK